MTYEAVTSLIRSEPTLSFKSVIFDNGSGMETTQWIENTQFDKKIMSSKNIGIAKAMDVLWDECQDSKYILNVEDDWVYNKQTEHSMIQHSIEILERHAFIQVLVLVRNFVSTGPGAMSFCHQYWAIRRQASGLPAPKDPQERWTMAQPARKILER